MGVIVGAGGATITGGGADTGAWPALAAVGTTVSTAFWLLVLVPGVAPLLVVLLVSRGGANGVGSAPDPPPAAADPPPTAPGVPPGVPPPVPGVVAAARPLGPV